MEPFAATAGHGFAAVLRERQAESCRELGAPTVCPAVVAAAGRGCHRDRSEAPPKARIRGLESYSQNCCRGRRSLRGTAGAPVPPLYPTPDPAAGRPADQVEAPGRRQIAHLGSWPEWCYTSTVASLRTGGLSFAVAALTRHVRAVCDRQAEGSTGELNAADLSSVLRAAEVLRAVELDIVNITLKVVGRQITSMTPEQLESVFTTIAGPRESEEPGAN